MTRKTLVALAFALCAVVTHASNENDGWGDDGDDDGWSDQDGAAWGSDYEDQIDQQEYEQDLVETPPARQGWDNYTSVSARLYHMMVFTAAQEVLGTWGDLALHCLASFAGFTSGDLVTVTGGDYSGFTGVFKEYDSSTLETGVVLCNIKSFDAVGTPVAYSAGGSRYQTIYVPWSLVQLVRDVDYVKENQISIIEKTKTLLSRIYEEKEKKMLFKDLQMNLEVAQKLISTTGAEIRESNLTGTSKSARKAVVDAFNGCVKNLKSDVQKAQAVRDPNDVDLKTLGKLRLDLCSHIRLILKYKEVFSSVRST